MNRTILCGRLVRDPDVRYNGENKSSSYTLAVDRAYKKEGGQEADFINCVVFGKGADFVEKYLHKGTKILVEGRIQTGSYTNKDGNKVYTTDVVVERHEFVESKGSGQAQQTAPPPAAPAPQQMPPQYDPPQQGYPQQPYPQNQMPQYQQQQPYNTAQQPWMQIPPGSADENPFT